MARLRITNREARRLWLWSHGLSGTPTGPLDVLALIRRIGFLQIDTIRNVTRAHNHILWTRNQNFREGMLWPLLERRALFEHFTHDASLIPMELLPDWQRQFERLGAKVMQSEWYRSGLGREAAEAIRARIAQEGPLSTHAFDTKARSHEMWARPPHKKALEQMWYRGDLATSHRRNFVKFYDLSERVFPSRLRARDDPRAQAHRLCDRALDRISMGTSGEIQRFWAAMDAAEVRAWLEAERSVVPLSVQAADGVWHDSWGAPDIEARLMKAPAPTSRLRIINPFDPAIRDRARLQRLFGFEYRNEIFVPRNVRRWGYYVYPLLEGDRFVGRCEIKADRAQGRLKMTGFWGEPGVGWSDRRLERLWAELVRFARLAGISEVRWDGALPVCS